MKVSMLYEQNNLYEIERVFSLRYNRICASCNKSVTGGTKCPCKKTYNAATDHPGPSWRFQKLRKKIIIRDKGHCQSCRIKYGLFVTEPLECHHIKS